MDILCRNAPIKRATDPDHHQCEIHIVDIVTHKILDYRAHFIKCQNGEMPSDYKTVDKFPPRFCYLQSPLLMVPLEWRTKWGDEICEDSKPHEAPSS